MRAIDVRYWRAGGLISLFAIGLVLRYLIIAPYGFLLGEDAYFHREVTAYFVSAGVLPQYDIGGWAALHPYYLALSDKVLAYPWGFHVLLYPFSRIGGDTALRYLPVAVSSFTPLAVYLFARELSQNEAVGFFAAALSTTQDVVAHSVLLLPQSLGLLILPVSLYLYLKTRYGALIGALMFFVHPFSGVVIMACVISLGLWRGEYWKTARLAALSGAVIAVYTVMTMLNSAPGEAFGFGMPTVVWYGAQRYINAFGLVLLFPIGIYFMRGRGGRYLIIPAFILGMFSLFKVSNLPPERFFSYLSIPLACMAAYVAKGIDRGVLRAAFAGALIIVASMSSAEIFGQIGPSRVEMASWEYLAETTVADATLLGWNRYPQIFSTRRQVVSGAGMGATDYISPDATMLATTPLTGFTGSDAYSIFYDNFVPLMQFRSDG